MIPTEEHKNIPATVVHRITGEVSLEDAEKGINEAIKIFEAAIQKYSVINVIVNAQGVNFTSLIAHKTWSQGLKDCSALRENVNYGIMVLDDSPNARAEKEFMESERLKFFFDLEEGEYWLRDKAGNPSA